MKNEFIASFRVIVVTGQVVYGNLLSPDSLAYQAYGEFMWLSSVAFHGHDYRFTPFCVVGWSGFGVIYYKYVIKMYFPLKAKVNHTIHSLQLVARLSKLSVAGRPVVEIFGSKDGSSDNS